MAKPAHRVQLLKQETAAGGGDPNDLGELFYEDKINTREDAPEAAGLFLQSPSGPDDEECYVTRDDSGNMLLKDENADSGNEVTLSELLESAAGGITESEHRSLDQLVHDIAETSYDEIVYTAGKVTRYTTWQTASKVKRIREITVTYSGNQVTNIKTEQFDSDGNLITGETINEVPTYSGSQITAVTRTLS